MAASGRSPNQTLSKQDQCVLKDLQSVFTAYEQNIKDNPVKGREYIVIHHGSVVPMPNEYDEVFPNIYIGGESIAKNKARIVNLGFTHIINCAQGRKFNQVDTGSDFYLDMNIHYFGIPGHDSVKFDMSRYFHEAAGFMYKALTKEEGKVFVHCHQGLSRSAAVIMAYLMIHHKKSAVDSLQTILEKRYVRPNDGFLKRLAILNNELFS